MSKTIGHVHGFEVMASTGGIELHGRSVANEPEETITLTVKEAFEFAALLMEGAASSTRMILGLREGQKEEPTR